MAVTSHRMKTANLFLIILVTVFCACENIASTSYRNEIHQDTLYAYDQNDILRIKAPISEDMKNGLVEFYDSLGQIHIVANFVDDVMDGFYKEYYPSGIVKADAYFLNGKRFGEYLEYYDGYEDSMAVERDGEWWIEPYPTKLKEYRFYDLKEEIRYLRKYDVSGDLISKNGRIFQETFHREIDANVGDTFTQSWITPDLSHLKQVDVDQYYVVSTLTSNENYQDTIYTESDSTVTRWHSSLKEIGVYEIQAIAYLVESDHVETDTSTFKVKINDKDER